MNAHAAIWALLIAPAAACGREQMPASIQDVKARHTAEFMGLPGVVSVGIGRDSAGTPVIVVGLDQERPQTRAALPQQVEGHVVRVEVTGVPRAQ